MKTLFAIAVLAVLVGCAKPKPQPVAALAPTEYQPCVHHGAHVNCDDLSQGKYQFKPPVDGK